VRGFCVFVERFGSGEGREAEEAWGVLPSCGLVIVCRMLWTRFGGQLYVPFANTLLCV
jgi:hypothetical protein